MTTGPSPESSYRDHERAAATVGIAFAVVTFSDTRTSETDRSGATIRELLEGAGHRVVAARIVPDEPAAMHACLDELLSHSEIRAIITNGGTGISARDSAAEVVERLLDKRLDGFGELFRMLSYAEIGAAAMLSRATGGVAGGKIVFALPGSTNAVRLGMSKLILPQVGHLAAELAKQTPAGPSP